VWLPPPEGPAGGVLEDPGASAQSRRRQGSWPAGGEARSRLVGLSQGPGSRPQRRASLFGIVPSDHCKGVIAHVLGGETSAGEWVEQRAPAPAVREGEQYVLAVGFRGIDPPSPDLRLPQHVLSGWWDDDFTPSRVSSARKTDRLLELPTPGAHHRLGDGPSRSRTSNGREAHITFRSVGRRVVRCSCPRRPTSARVGRSVTFQLGRGLGRPEPIRNCRLQGGTADRVRRRRCEARRFRSGRTDQRRAGFGHPAAARPRLVSSGMTAMSATVTVIVKAAPVLTASLDETMCVAGARLTDDGVEWIRLHPVPFRDLATEARFAKYQEMEAELIRPRTDRRPESWRPLPGSIRLGRRLGTERAWADRRDLVSRLYQADMCDLVDANPGLLTSPQS